MRITLVTLLVFASNLIFSQNKDIVKWSYAAEEVEEGIVELTFTADIKKGWVIYGTEENEDGPIPTGFEFENLDGYTVDGKPVAKSEGKTNMDDMFGIQLTKYKGQAIFVQRIKVEDKSKPVTGYLTYMTCDGERCLPPTDVDFSFDLN